MEEFINKLNERHKHRVGYPNALKTEIITKEFLIKNDIIKIKNNQIVYLDTTLIGKEYLDAFNEEFIEMNKFLEHLVFANVGCREINLSSIKGLKKIEYISCSNSCSLYIFENENLKEFDISSMNRNAEDDDLFTLSLFASPHQLINVIPAKIEKRAKYDDGYLGIRLSLAPKTTSLNDKQEKALNQIQYDKLPLKYLLKFKEANINDIIFGYWNELSPIFLSQYQTIEEAKKNHNEEEYILMIEIEEKIESGFYKNNEGKLSFDELSSSIEEQKEYYGEKCKREIPDFMYKKE